MKKTIAIMLAFAICASLCACTLTCSRCDGEGMITCPKCVDGWKKVCYKCNAGEMRSECTNCGGDGIELNFELCETCEYKGYFINPFTWERFECAVCDGKGHYSVECKERECKDGYVYETCTACNGDYREKCADCDDGKTPCPECK